MHYQTHRFLEMNNVKCSFTLAHVSPANSHELILYVTKFTEQVTYKKIRG